MKLLVTGGAGFIGSAVVRLALARGHAVVNLDALGYAANPATLAPFAGNPHHAFEQADIRDAPALHRILAQHQPDAILHLAAQTHVDRSIDGPGAFISTNVTGTYTLLEAARGYWRDQGQPGSFRFHHVGTDEVFGSLPPEGQFTEASPYAPRSPYAASKAAADHLVRAWHHTYGLPVVLSTSANTYGPFQFPEKLVPVVILHALCGKPVPIYGDGTQVRDWLHVDDHAAALLDVLQKGEVGRSYGVSAETPRSNLDLVRTLCALLDAKRPRHEGSHADQIVFVPDRPGHDARYATDATRLRTELGWRPGVTLDEGLARTVDWYLARKDWWQPLLARAGGRRGLGA